MARYQTEASPTAGPGPETVNPKNRHIAAPKSNGCEAVILSSCPYTLRLSVLPRRALLEGRSPLRVPPRTRYRAIVDLENYFCAFPHFLASQGKDARITIGWAESLYEEMRRTVSNGRKGNRNDIDKRPFDGFADTFILDGGENRNYTTLWWEACRYIEILIETQDEELVR
jgi:alpha-L-rhamnosidase